MSVAEPISTTVSIFMNRSNQAIRIPKAMGFPGVTQLEATRMGDELILRPVKPSWESFFEKWSGQGDEEFFTRLEESHDVLEYRPVDFTDENQ